MPYKLTGKTDIGGGFKLRRIATQLRDLSKSKEGWFDADAIRFMLTPIQQEIGADPWELFQQNLWKLQEEGVIVMDKRETIKMRNEIVEKLREQISHTKRSMEDMVRGQLEPFARSWSSQHAAWLAARTFTSAVIADIIKDAKHDEPLCHECGHRMKLHADGGTGACRCGDCAAFRN